VQQQRLERAGRSSTQHVTRLEPIVWRLGGWRWVCFGLVFGYFCFALFLPLGAVTITAFLPYAGAPIEAVSIRNFARLFDSDLFRASIANTLIFSVVGASVAVALGTVGAYCFRRLQPPGAWLWDMIASAPIALPGIVVGLGYLWLAVGTPIYGTLVLTTLVVVVRFVPFALRSGTAALTRVDRSLDEAARIAGASEVRVFSRIVTPNILTSIVSMWGLLFVLFTHEIDTNILLQGTNNGVLAVQIYSWYQYGGVELAAAGSLVLLVMTAIALAIVGLVVRLWRGVGVVR
jgi:iron(III) transport system permease protein